MTISIGFHDVVEEVPFAPGHKTVYPLERHVFLGHLAAIRSRTGVDSVSRVDQVGSNDRTPVFVTVDDGYVSGFTYIAPELEKLGWRGHFFVTTNWIGRPGFLDRQHIRELHQRGHLIGSHSCSHPEQMSNLSWEELLREWGDSCALLSDLIGAPTTVASVPGGYYSQKVGQAAAASGIKVLFTSEPTATAQFVNGCRVLGRYTVHRSTPPDVVGAIAAGMKWPRYQQAAIWFFNKAAKRVAGRWYLPARRIVLDRIYGR
jgi:peptidoglycan/xylan/chitin deacetylase (PgdA/CDA1 family)